MSTPVVGPSLSLPPLDTTVPPVWGVIAHVVHYTLVFGGLVGVAALLLPQYADHVPVLRRLLPATPRRLSEHDRRVAELRASLARTTVRAGDPSHSTLVTAPPRVSRPAGPPSTSPVHAVAPISTVALPVAVVASAAAAAVHAAVGPEHFEEGLLLGLFFACSSTAQLGWSILVLRQGARRACPAWLLWSGATGNLTCIVLWAITRTLGLPFNLIEGREAVGPWDVAAVGWEAMVVVVCLLALDLGYRQRRPRGPGPGSTETSQSSHPSGLAVGAWPQWHVAARLLVLCSFAVLVALSFAGAGA